MRRTKKREKRKERTYKPAEGTQKRREEVASTKMIPTAWGKKREVGEKGETGDQKNHGKRGPEKKRKKFQESALGEMTWNADEKEKQLKKIGGGRGGWGKSEGKGKPAFWKVGAPRTHRKVQENTYKEKEGMSIPRNGRNQGNDVKVGKRENVRGVQCLLSDKKGPGKGGAHRSSGC